MLSVSAKAKPAEGPPQAKDETAVTLAEWHHNCTV